MPRILLVDDDALMIAMLRDILESTGQYQVASAPDGIHGLKFLGMEPAAEIKAQLGEMDWKFVPNEWTSDPSRPVLPELILSDCVMPRMDGMTFLTEVCRDERVKNIPVLVLTSKLRMEEPFLRLPNVRGFILKPSDPAQLMALVEKTLSKA